MVLLPSNERKKTNPSKIIPLHGRERSLLASPSAPPNRTSVDLNSFHSQVSETAYDGPRGSHWSREEVLAWQRMGESTQGSGLKFLLTAVLVHLFVFWLAQVLPSKKVFDTEQSLSNSKNQHRTTRVTFIDPTHSSTHEKGDPEPQPYPNAPVDSPVITGPSTSARRAQPKTSELTKPSTTAARTRQDSTHSPTQPILVPGQKEPLADKEAPQDSMVGIGFSKNLRDLLPNSESEYVASQRRIGTVYGQGAVGGDIDTDSSAPVGYKAPKKGEVNITRYDYAAYFAALDQRFSEAWGGTRFLPRGSTFVGSAGEVIEYDIVIHRNGALSKIINVSKQKQKNRDFAAVDNLVHEVFSHVFPLSPIPARIKEDPLILRKRIQFTGYQYFMF